MASLGHSLTDAERQKLIDTVERDGYAVLPFKLTPSIIANFIGAIDRISADVRKARPEGSQQSVKSVNIVDQDEAFRDLLMYTPALQLAYDSFGPMFHLCQSNFISRPKEDANSQTDDFISASPWHADGPRPALFPKVNGVMGLHYLKFGYFLTDLTHGNGGPLQVVRGTHKHPELDNKGFRFNIDDYKDDLVTFNVEAGSIVVFHQAQWHAAPLNYSDIERKNIYISYCPTWMKPLDREYPTQQLLDSYKLTAEASWILHEPRTPIRWWLPSTDDLYRLDKYRRAAEAGSKIRNVNYD